jgi:hypothetical protein
MPRPAHPARVGDALRVDVSTHSKVRFSTAASTRGEGDMDRIRTVAHKGKEILVLDYAGLDTDGYKAMMKEAIREISARAPSSALTVTVVTGTRFALGATENIRAYSEAIRPFVKASAVVGLSSLQRVVYLAVRPFLTSGIEAFGTMEEAKDWLVAKA